MKIGIFIDEMNIRGGTHKQVFRLASYLSGKNHEVRIFTRYYDPTKGYPGVEKIGIIHPWDWKEAPKGRLRRHFVGLMGTLYLLWKARDLDAVNIHDNCFLVLGFVLRWLAPRRYRLWQVNDLPGCFRVGPSRDLPDSPYYAFLRWTFRCFAGAMDAITVNVTKNAMRVREYMGRNAIVAYCGVDLRSTAPQPSARASNGPVRLVSTGIFYPYRNYETIIRAQSRLQKDYGIKSRLTILGSVRLDPAYHEHIRRLAEQERVDCRILGEVSEETLVREYTEADVFLFLNIDQSWGLAVFEAMNLGLPVIVSDSAGATEMLKNEKDSLIVNPEDETAVAEAIRNLYSDVSLYEMIRIEGYRRTLDMTWDKLYCRQICSMIEARAAQS